MTTSPKFDGNHILVSISQQFRLANMKCCKFALILALWPLLPPPKIVTLDFPTVEYLKLWISPRGISRFDQIHQIARGDVALLHWTCSHCDLLVKQSPTPPLITPLTIPPLVTYPLSSSLTPCFLWPYKIKNNTSPHQQSIPNTTAQHIFTPISCPNKTQSLYAQH